MAGRLHTSVTALVIVMSLAAAAAAQGPGQWYYENVSQPAIEPGCSAGATLAGFDHDPQGRPLLAWREGNRCGEGRVFWTRKDGDQWTQTESSSNGFAHEFAIRPGDGNPFFIYGAQGPFFATYTFRTDVVANTTEILEGLAGPQNCTNVNYATAFASNADAPDWGFGLALCGGRGPVRLNGATIADDVYSPRVALAVTPDGVRHLLWNTGTDFRYSRVVNGALDQTTTLFTNGNRFGGEVRLQSDANGTLHALLRGVEGDQADWDPGSLVYIASVDGGHTWSAPEYVDPYDTTPDIVGAITDIALALDANGVAAAAYWKWGQELWFARRDGPGGTWTQSLVTTRWNADAPRGIRLDFAPDGTPELAFYDVYTNRVRIARPVPDGTTMPVDMSVSITGLPAVVPPGAPLTYAITVTNRGITNQDSVVLENVLPENAATTSTAPEPSADGQWHFPLNSGASTTFTVTATAPLTEGWLIDAARVSTSLPDAHPLDNAATAAVLVAANPQDAQPMDGLDSRVVVSARRATSEPLGVITFDIGVQNTGNVDIPSVPLAATLSGGASILDAAPGPMLQVGASVHYAIGPLAVGQWTWAVVRATAPVTPAEVTLSAVLSTPGDLNPANDVASAHVSVRSDSCFVTADSLIARWRADGNATDDVGDHDGTLMESAGYAPGRLGSAFSFNGNNDHVVVADSPALRPAQVTLSAWAFPTSFAGNNSPWDTVIAKGASGADGNMAWYEDTLWLGFHDGYPTFITYHLGRGGVLTMSPTPVSRNQWHLLTATYDGSVARLYVNGEQVAENEIGVPLYYDAQDVPLTFGQDWQGGGANGAPFDGRIDDIVLYDRALSPAEVLARFDGSSTDCGNDNEVTASTPIRNGTPESRPQFSGVGMILPSATHGACTATLISPLVVLTAAQCLRDNSPDHVFEFSLGPGRTATVTDIRVHPLAETFDGFNLAFDVALVKLDSAVASSWTDVIPATLRSDLPATGIEADAIGFGETSAGAGDGRRTSGTLLLTQYLAGEGPIGNFWPTAFLEAIPGSADQMFCPAGTGGPLFVEDQIVGVASFRFVEPCTEPGPGYYVTVNHLADWIQATLNELSRPATTTVVTSSLNPSVFGQLVTLTATVTGTAPGAGAPRGTVTFQDNGVTIATQLVDFFGHATLQTGALASGSHGITALYGGSATFAPSASDALVQIVNQDATVTILQTDPSPARVGDPVEFDVAVRADQGAIGFPTGTVTLMEGLTVIAAMASLGGATFHIDNLPAGIHVISAVYSGDANFTGSTSNAVTKEIKVPTVHSLTSLTITPRESHFLEFVTLTASVCCGPGPLGTPTGFVTFVEGTTIVGGGPLINQVATFRATLPIGTHLLKAIYEGDATFIGSTSGAAQAIVRKIPTTTTLSSSPPPAVPLPPPAVGLRRSVNALQPVTLTATVSGNLDPAPDGGTVTFMDDGTALGTAPLDASRHASLTTILSGGTHSITAVYGGNDTFASSTSDFLLHEVSWGSFTATLTASPEPSFVGQPVTFTMTIHAESPGDVPGWVTFDGGADVYVSHNQATYTTSSLGVGAHTIFARYHIGPLVASAIAAWTQHVIKKDTTTAVEAMPVVSVFGQPVTLTATVTTTQSGTPSGLVTFRDGTTTLGTATLGGGQATYISASFLPGTHSVTAVYGGDADFNGSTSVVITQATKQGASTTTVMSTANPSVIGQPVTVTVAVTAHAPAAGTPTGMVTVAEGATTLGTATLTNGQASVNLPALPVGTHLITVSYSGDSHFAGSTGELNQIVNSISTAIGVIAENIPAMGAGTTNALTSQLAAAIQAATRGQNKTAANMLGAFVNSVSALVNSGRLSSSTASELVAPAKGLIVLLR